MEGVCGEVDNPNGALSFEMNARGSFFEGAEARPPGESPACLRSGSSTRSLCRSDHPTNAFLLMRGIA